MVPAPPPNLWADSNPTFGQLDAAERREIWRWVSISIRGRPVDEPGGRHACFRVLQAGSNAANSRLRRCRCRKRHPGLHRSEHSEKPSRRVVEPVPHNAFDLFPQRSGRNQRWRPGSAPRKLLVRLQEPNETHFGLSKGKSRGRGLGPYLVQRITNNLVVSRAAETGLLEDLEDTALFIEGIGKDIISDVTTNIIRGMLISYTQSMASIYGMELQEGVYSGLVWNPSTCDWEEGIRECCYQELPCFWCPR